MVWQDIALSIASIIFAYSIIPQIFYGFKTKKGLISLQLSILSVVGMAAVTIAYFSLNLYFSGILSIIVTLSWAVLTYQRIAYGKVKN